jgi:hypothetical protein
MSVTWSLNLSPATGSEAMFNIKTALKAAGWTVPRSGSGSGGSTTTSDLITSAGTGVGGMANTSCWFVIQAPAGGRQFCIQRGGSTTWWIQYSFSAGFTGGSPSATVVPTATDAVNVLATSSTGVTLFSTDNTYRQNIMVDGSSPYGFYSVAWAAGGGVVSHLFMMDPVTSTPSDADPYVFIASGKGSVTQLFPVANSSFGANNAFMRTDLTNSSGGTLSGYLKKGLAGEGFASLSVMAYHGGNAGSSSLHIPGNLGNNPNNTNDDQFPVVYARNVNTVGGGTANSNPTGYKGVSTLLRWLGTNRVTGDLLSVSATGDRVVVDGAATLPWQSGTAVTL